MSENRTAADISEQLFQAIDAIVMERIRVLKYDKTVIATIIENNKAPYGKYKVTTDDNITFYAYADTSKYALHDKVYIRIPEGDYTKQKIIIGYYISDNNEQLLKDYVKTEQKTDLQAAEDELKKYRALSSLDTTANYLDELKTQLKLLNKDIIFDNKGNIKNKDSIISAAQLTNNTELLQMIDNYLVTLQKKLKLLNSL